MNCYNTYCEVEEMFPGKRLGCVWNMNSISQRFLFILGHFAILFNGPPKPEAWRSGRGLKENEGGEEEEWHPTSAAPMAVYQPPLFTNND